MALVALYFLSGPLMRHVPHTVLHPLEPASTVAARHYDPALASSQAALEAREDQSLNGATVYDLAVRLPAWAGLAFILAAGFSVPKKPTQAGDDPLPEA